MRGSGSVATGDLQAVLAEIGGRLTQAAQSVEAVGRTVAALAEGLTATDAEGLVPAATARLIGLALGGAWPTAAMGATAKDGRDARSNRKESGQEIELGAFLGRILEDLPVVAVEVGSASCRKGDQLVAIGIEANGAKRVLGIQPGSGANREAVEQLAADLYRRGLHAANGGSLLLITEGTDAADAAFLGRWPRGMRVAHCQKAVMDKVLAHLSADDQEHVREELRAAYSIAEASRALARLEALEQRLRSRWPGAAASLSRHAAASLTVKRLGVGGMLERSISTLSVLRTAVEQARLWGREAQGAGSMDPLPLGAVLWEQRTRRVIGYEDLPQLVAALARTGLERTA